MGRLEEIIEKERQSRGEDTQARVDMTVDAALKEEDKALVEEAKRTRLEEMVELRKKHIAEHKRDTEKISSGMIPNSPQSVSVSANTTAAILKMLVDSGMDGEKANSFLKELDQETLAKMAIMSGTSRGVDALLPLILFSKNSPSTSMKEIADISRAYIDDYKELLNNSGGGQPTFSEQMTALIELNKAMHPPADPAAAAAKDALALKLDAIVEANHAAQLEFQKQISSLKETQLQGEISGIKAQLTALQSRDLSAEVTKMKDTLSVLGIPVGQGAAPQKKEVDFEKLTETILKAPAIERAVGGLADAVKIGAQRRAAEAQAHPAAVRPTSPASVVPPNVETAKGTPFLCDRCLSRGVETPLFASKEVMEGKGSVKCHICGADFGKGSGPSSPPSGGGGGGGDINSGPGFWSSS